jgi:HAD superfamily hydrolase (TIGR01509 family)
MSNIKAVLFDMGGVIVQLDSLENVLGPSALNSVEIWNAWILSEAVQQFERGHYSVEHFAAEILGELELEGTVEAFIERFIAFPQGLYPGAVDVVQDVPNDVITALLSNTSEIHWENQKDADVVRSLCDRSYLSYELGLAKPEREIFDHAVADLDLAASQVLFIDDNQINVDGARAGGLRAGLAKGPDEARQVLRTFGVI